MKTEGLKTLISSTVIFIGAFILLMLIINQPKIKKESSNVFFKNGNRYVITTKIWGGILYKDTILSNK